MWIKEKASKWTGIFSSHETLPLISWLEFRWINRENMPREKLVERGDKAPGNQQGLGQEKQPKTCSLLMGRRGAQSVKQPPSESHHEDAFDRRFIIRADDWQMHKQISGLVPTAWATGHQLHQQESRACQDGMLEGFVDLLEKINSSCFSLSFLKTISALGLSSG